MNDEEKKPTVKKIDYKKMIDIVPKRDFHLNCPPYFVEQLKRGEKISVPEFLKQNLKTEEVI